MPRKPNRISESEIQNIRRDILEKGSIKVLNPVDCKDLSKHILLLTGHYISDSTLKRFFKFHNTSFKPSYDTVKILRDYLLKIQLEYQPSVSAADMVIDFFSPLHFENIDKSDSIFQAACRSIAVHLKSDQKLFESVMEPLAKNPLGRAFYYELFPDYEILNQFQFKGYELYLKYENSNEGKLFGNCILFLKYFFEKDKNGIKKQWKEIFRKFTHFDIHPFVLGRVFQCKLIYQYYFDAQSIQETIQKIFELQKRQSRSSKLLFRDFPGFHYFCCDGLYHVNQYAALTKLSAIALRDFREFPEFVWKGYYNHLKIYHSLGLMGQNNSALAKKLVQGMKSDDFYFISRKYFENLLNHIRCSDIN